MSETSENRSARQSESKRAITQDRYDAVPLDLDGVITDTASIHAACWKQMFDEYLQKRATQIGEVFRPFNIATDYRLYVDGKPRYDGVRDFLISRGIKSATAKWTREPGVQRNYWCRAHPRGPGVDCPVPRRPHPDPHVRFVDLSCCSEHAARGKSAGPRCDSDDAVFA